MRKKFILGNARGCELFCPSMGPGLNNPVSEVQGAMPNTSPFTLPLLGGLVDYHQTTYSNRYGDTGWTSSSLFDGWEPRVKACAFGSSVATTIRNLSSLDDITSASKGHVVERLSVGSENCRTVDFPGVETQHPNHTPRTRTKTCADLPTVNRQPHMGFGYEVRSVEFTKLPVNLNAGEKWGCLL
jgi:hypothetical protein